MTLWVITSLLTLSRRKKWNGALDTDEKEEMALGPKEEEEIVAVN